MKSFRKICTKVVSLFICFTMIFSTVYTTSYAAPKVKSQTTTPITPRLLTGALTSTPQTGERYKQGETLSAAGQKYTDTKITTVYEVEEWAESTLTTGKLNMHWRLGYWAGNPRNKPIYYHAGDPSICAKGPEGPLAVGENAAPCMDMELRGFEGGFGWPSFATDAEFVAAGIEDFRQKVREGNGEISKAYENAANSINVAITEKKNSLPSTTEFEVCVNGTTWVNARTANFTSRYLPELIFNTDAAYSSHCDNGTNYLIIQPKIDLRIRTKEKTQETTEEYVYGPISYTTVGFTMTNPPTIQTTSSIPTWSLEGLVIETIDPDNIVYINNEPYGQIIVTQTPPGGTPQTVTINVPLAYDLANNMNHFTATLRIDDVIHSEEQLYLPGDVISLDGIRCSFWNEFTIEGVENPIIRNKEFKGVRITLKGFDVEGISAKDSNGNQYLKIEDSTAENWNTEKDKYKIINVKNDYYDRGKGVHYGIVEVVGCEGAFGACAPKIFKIYFGPRIKITPVNLTIFKNPGDSAGDVYVTYSKVTGAGGNYTVETAIDEPVADGGTIKVLAGSTAEIKPRPGSNYAYEKITTIHGNKLHDRNDKLDSSGKYLYAYPVPNNDSSLVVVFQYDNPDGAYTLYVSSTEGGNAWTVGNENHPQSEVKTSANVLGSNVYYIKNVRGNEKFKLYYEVEDGYEFEKWEYRPRILCDSSSKKDCTVDITMPFSDLTATAIFKKITPPEDSKPTLRVTTNNDLWGSAWAIVDGKEIKISKVTPGVEYTVYFKANEGYYFTNFDYDSEESPFLSLDVASGTGIIKMTANDLEVKAFFAPIPTPPVPDPDPEVEGHDVTFVGESEEGVIGEGGNVPENLTDILWGLDVTMAVTPYEGWEFVRWYFVDENGASITPNNEWDGYGSGKFIMPNYDVVAHAVFRRVQKVNLTVYIYGEGQVTAGGKLAQHGVPMQVKPGDLEIISTPWANWDFVRCTNRDGVVLSEDSKFIFDMPNVDTEIFVWFMQKGDYTLYVTSLEGGNAWTKGNENHPESSVKVTKNDLNQYVYKVEKVKAGEVFDISYSVEPGYTFSKWEYRPYVTPENTNGKNPVAVTMPDSDLTVTAIFKKDEIKVNPKLTVTSNNKEWGRAWTVLNGTETEMDKKYPAIAGDEYTVYYRANEGYYFTNWDYSTSGTPFIGENEILMPNMDLEVMAFFSPIPVPGPEGHDVTFVAEPPEGGSVPENLEKVKPGDSVTIAVTPNQGWEFEYWYFTDEDGNIVYPTNGYDNDGTGYFIMPDYPITAHAVFTEKVTGVYNLYITYTNGGTAWTHDENGKNTVHIPNAIPGNTYDLCMEISEGYEFVEWQYRWNDECGDGIEPNAIEDEGKAVMPHSDMTVTAVFKKIDIPDTNNPKLKVTSNNYFWGNAWVTIDGLEYSWKQVGGQQASSNLGITVEAGKTYEIRFKQEDGYKFTDWRTFEGAYKHLIRFTYFENGDTTATLKMPNYDLEMMAYFKPGNPEPRTYTLTVVADPNGGGTVNGGASGLSEGEKTYPKVSGVSKNYKFEYWYRIIGEEKIKVSYDKNFIYVMPGEDVTLYAKFKYDGPGPDPDPDPDPSNSKYKVTVRKEGNGTGTVNSRADYPFVAASNLSTGDKVNLMAVPNSTSEFGGWYIGGKCISLASTYTVEIKKADVVVYAHFNTMRSEENVVGDFKIISVRDLRWKDYFVTGNNLTNKYFGIPSSLTTMLHDDGNYKQPIKMGYATEFELKTVTIPKDKAVVVITPNVYVGDTLIPWGQIKDEITGKMMNDSSEARYSNIIIYGNNKNTNSKSYHQTKATDNSSIMNNGVAIEEITWQWVYYLPAKISFNYMGKNSANLNEVTIRFKVEVHQVNGNISENDIIKNTNGTLKMNLVDFVRYYDKKQWVGDTFKYSLKDSLLDDIYNNAAN